MNQLKLKNKHRNQQFRWILYKMKINWKDFANDLLDIAFEGGDIDAGDLQNIALQYGLLRAVEAYGPCGDSCRCEEFGDFPCICLRKTWRK